MIEVKASFADLSFILRSEFEHGAEPFLAFIRAGVFYAFWKGAEKNKKTREST